MVYPALHLVDAILPVLIGSDALSLAGLIAVGLVLFTYFKRPIKTFRTWRCHVLPDKTRTGMDSTT